MVNALPIPSGTDYYYRFVVLDEDGEPATGLTDVECRIRRDSSPPATLDDSFAWITGGYGLGHSPPVATEIGGFAPGTYEIRIPTTAGVAARYDVYIQAPAGSYPRAYSETLEMVLNNLSEADVEGACESGLSDYGTATAAEVAAVLEGVADAVWNADRAGYKVAGSFGNDLPIASAIADAVWDELRSGHTDAGSFGAVAEWASSTAPTASAIADAVWDELRSGHTDAGSFGAVAEWAASIGPYVAVNSPGNRLNSPIIYEMLEGAKKTFTIEVRDAAGAVVDLSSLPLQFAVFDSDGNQQFKIEGITGTAGGIAQATVTAEMSATPSNNWGWALTDESDDDNPVVLVYGSFFIKAANLE